MQHGSRVRIESDHSGQGIERASAFDDRAHHQLVSQVQTIKDPKGQHRGALDLSVVSSMK